MKKTTEKIITKDIIIKGLNFPVRKAFGSKDKKILSFFLKKVLILWIIAIVVFYKN